MFKPDIYSGDVYSDGGITVFIYIYIYPRALTLELSHSLDRYDGRDEPSGSGTSTEVCRQFNGFRLTRLVPLNDPIRIWRL